jgi:hypothetical protein
LPAWTKQWFDPFDQAAQKLPNNGPFDAHRSNRLAFVPNLGQNACMSVTGKVVNGLVVLPPGTRLPEGSAVKVETLEPVVSGDPLIAAVEKLAKARPHLPDDYALNHGHYIRGEPKK